MAMKWYGVHTYSGYENKVKLNLEERIRSLEAEEFFWRNSYSFRDGHRVEKKGKEKLPRGSFFPVTSWFRWN